MKTVAIYTLGCRSNQYDSAAIEGILETAGLEIVDAEVKADAYIINTCTVTSRTDSQSRQAARRLRRLNPEAVLVVTGCYAQVSPDEAAMIEGVDFVVGNPEKSLIPELLKKNRRNDDGIEGVKKIVGASEEGVGFELRAQRAARGRTRANLKIQDGCDRSCSYCIIPKARGRSRSLAQDGVLVEIESLVSKGVKEIVFTGIHLGGWGTDLKPEDGPTFAGLLKRIEERAYPCRFRISSIDPDEVTDEFIDVVAASETICNHIHMPIQSGSDSVLALMKRPYKSDYFAERVARLRSLIKGVCIGTDIIAGFPGESEKEFEKSLSFMEGLPVSYMHIFPYSERKGTAASRMPGQVEKKVIKERAKRLKMLDLKKREGFYRGRLDTLASVLVEGEKAEIGTEIRPLKGRSRDYIPVRFQGPATLVGSEVALRLTGLIADGMSGIIENGRKAIDT